MRAKRILLLFLVTFGSSSIFAQLVINPTFVDGAGQSWTNTQKAVFNQAVNDWMSVIDHPLGGAINVTVTFANAGTTGYLGQWSVGYSAPYGTDIYAWTPGVNHQISFNADLFTGDNYLWWDATLGTKADQPFETWDALSVSRHEIGHMLGISSGIYVNDLGSPDQIDRWGSLISADVFDSGGLSISMANASHFANTNGGYPNSDLMNPALYNGSRLDISSMDIQALAVAHGYTAIPEPATVAFLLGLFAICFVAKKRFFSKKRSEVI